MKMKSILREAILGKSILGRSILGLSLAAAASMAVAGSASAADLPPTSYKAPTYVDVPLFNWTSFYIGLHAGYGFGNSNRDVPPASVSPGGFVGGAQLGFNYQVSSLVFGLEGDYGYSGMKGDTACVGGVCNVRNNWLATTRGRIGYAFDRFMPYFTGGLAFGNIKADHTLLGQASSTRTGYTLGGGLEYAFREAWSMRAEYLYVDLGRFDAGPAPLPNSVGFNANILRAGVNYRF
jgi:outer membrane immunogenic protein